jgi:hypothetical protein
LSGRTQRTQKSIFRVSTSTGINDTVDRKRGDSKSKKDTRFEIDKGKTLVKRNDKSSEKTKIEGNKGSKHEDKMITFQR